MKGALRVDETVQVAIEQALPPPPSNAFPVTRSPPRPTQPPTRRDSGLRRCVVKS